MKSAMFGLVRVLAPVTVILFTCSAVAALQQQRAEPSADLQSFVNETRLTQRLPGSPLSSSGVMASRRFT